MATPEELDNWFTYHPPTEEQENRYVLLRDKFRELAYLILQETPACADQTAALRQLRECSMAVNQSIACNENPVGESVGTPGPGLSPTGLHEAERETG